MAAPNIETIKLRLEVENQGAFKKVTSAFKDLTTNVKFSKKELAEQIKQFKDFTSKGKLSEKALKGQVKLFEELRSVVRTNSHSYKTLTNEITRAKAELEALNKVPVTAAQKRGMLADARFARSSFGGTSQLMQQISDIGLTQVTAQTERLGLSTDQLRIDINNAARAAGNSINSLNNQRAALQTLQNQTDLNSKEFKELGRDIDLIDKKLRKARGGNFNLGRASTALLGSAFVGGPSGLAGGLAGGAISSLTGGDVASGIVTGGLVGSQIIQPLAGAISESAKYTASLDKAKIALRGITKDQASFEIALRAANKATEEFNVPQEVAIKGMQRLSAAVLGAGGNVHNAEEAFLNTVAAIKATGGTADDVKSALTAMVQIFSKGKVSAEELSGQLGERFPGAVTAFAEANNMTTQSLQESLKNGTVGLDMLSKFIASLGKEYIPIAKEIAKSNAEAGARLVVATNKMRLAVGENFKDIGAEFQILQAELLTDLAPAVGEFARIAVAGFKVLTEVLKFVVKNFADIAIVVGTVSAAFATLKLQVFIAQIGGLSGLLTVLKAKWLLLGKAIAGAAASQATFNVLALVNPYVALASGIAAAIGLLLKFRATQDGLVDDTEKNLNRLKGLTKEELKAEIESLKKKKEALIKEREEISGSINKLVVVEEPLSGGIISGQFRKLYGSEPDKKVVNVSEADRKKGLFAEIQKTDKQLKDAEGTLSSLGGNKDFPSLKGANERTQKLVNLNTQLNEALEKRNALKELEIRRDIELEKLANKFEKKKTGKAGEETLSEKDKQDFENQKKAIGLKFQKDKNALEEKELATKNSILRELGLMSEKDFERAEIAARAREIHRETKGIIDGQSLSIEQITEKLTAAKQETFNFKESFAELAQSALDLETNIGERVITGIDSMGDAFADLVVDGKASFAELTVAILKDIQKMIIKALFFRAIMGVKNFLGFGDGGVVGNDVQGFGGQQVMAAAKGQVLAQNKIVPYAYGGIVSRPTLFPMANGAGLMGEAGPEAIMPLRRNKRGKLGVETSGATSNNVVNVSVDASGTSAQGNTMKANQLGKMIGTAIEAELIKQKRPGGILYE